MIKIDETGELEVHLKGKAPKNHLGKLEYSMLFGTLVILIIFYVITNDLLTTLFLSVLGVLLSLSPTLLRPKDNLITEGLLRVSKGVISHQSNGRHQVFELSKSKGRVQENKGIILLYLSQENPAKVLHISGFEYKREAEILLASLQGKEINVRKQEIKMRIKN